MPMGNNQPFPGRNFEPGVGPQYSKPLNQAILSQNTTDGNIGAYEQQYGAPGNEPSPYGGAPNGLSPQEQQGFQAQDQVFKQFMSVFGPEAGTAIMQDMIKQLAMKETAPHAMSGQGVPGMGMMPDQPAPMAPPPGPARGMMGRKIR